MQESQHYLQRDKKKPDIQVQMLKRWITAVLLARCRPSCMEIQIHGLFVKCPQCPPLWVSIFLGEFQMVALL